MSKTRMLDNLCHTDDVEVVITQREGALRGLSAPVRTCDLKSCANFVLNSLDTVQVTIKQKLKQSS